MSTLAGILYFDPKRLVTPDEIATLSAALGVAVQGEATTLQGCVAMAYRPFVTTAEQADEKQPLIRNGITVCWDGRIDNRSDLLRILALAQSTPDSEIALNAYLRWGRDGFGKLIGDWAAALWDGDAERLFLARDFIGVRRLFYRAFEHKVVWATDIEPLLGASFGPVHVDKHYVAGGFLLRSPLERTAYREIRSVVPAQTICWHQSNRPSQFAHWQLETGLKPNLSDRAYEDEFLHLFRQAVSRRLRSNHTIVAELSGGLDSSSIVCMADVALLEQQGPGLATLSYFDPEEPSGDERLYFSHVETQIGRVGYHISLASMRDHYKDRDLAPLPEGLFAATPGSFYRTYIWAKELQRIRTLAGARVVLSGMGGDELLGGVQYEAPELGSYLESWRAHAFLSNSLQWSLRRRKPMIHLWKEVSDLLRARRMPSRFVVQSQVETPPWLLLPRQVHHDALETFSNWRSLSAPQASMEWNRYLLASQLNCTDPPLIGEVERRYPFLDRDLYQFLASIPRSQIVRAESRRFLMRRAMRGVVPNEILTRRSKWFGEAAIVRSLRSDSVRHILREPWRTDGIVVDLPLLRKSVELAQQGAEGAARLVTYAIGVEQWARQQSHCLFDPISPFQPGESH